MRHSGKQRADDGFSLVVLAVMFTVMNILLAKALPLWSTQIQREREAELIFRGLQYAEAIRVFKLRFNRPPTRLQELIEVEPRCIRQLWNNPLSPDAAGKPAAIGWEPIFEGQPDLNRPDQRGARGRDRGFSSDRDPEDDRPLGPLGQPLDEGEVRIGPILGVRSTEGDTAIKLFFDSDSIKEWRFTPDVLEPRPLVGGGPTPMPLNAALIGRPWPPGVNPPIAARPSSPGQRRQRVGGGGLQQQPGAPQPGALQPGAPQPGTPQPGSPPLGRDLTQGRQNGRRQ